MLTHEELGIQQWEHDALVKLIDYLPTLENAPHTWKAPDGNAFCMSEAGEKWECGTVACIGGWAYIISKVDNRVSRANRYVWRNEVGPLAPLYFPHVIGSDWTGITVDIAVQAIKNFLNTGDPKWTELVTVA